MNREELENRIADLEDQLSKAKTLRDTFEKDPQFEVAEVLHDRFCNSNHADGCGWYYETWDQMGSTREMYLRRAEDLIAQLGQSLQKLAPTFVANRHERATIIIKLINKM